MRRRLFLAGTTLGLLGSESLGCGDFLSSEGSLFQRAPLDAHKTGLPGRYPGRVVEVTHPASVQAGRRNREAIAAMIRRGMMELVGSDDATEAWRSFFSSGMRVGIKVVPVGQPDAISSPEVVLEVIAGLRSAGVRAGDILVFERYKDEFLQCGYDRILPEGVHWECASARGDKMQLELDGQTGGGFDPKVSGYDRDIYRELQYCQPEADPADDRRFRSHLAKIVSQKVDKFISIPVLKDHRSSGVTLALKNLSHGLSNNVARSHMNVPWEGVLGRQMTSMNQCNTFIPILASLPPIVEKAALQILDGLIGVWEGGPGIWNKTFALWEYKSLLFATDPVALDHIGWEIIDRKRSKEGWPSVAQMGLEGRFIEIEEEGKKVPSEQFSRRQPEHIPLSATSGLGVFDRPRIEHRTIVLL